MARIRSSPRARVSTAKPAATARNGLTRPKYWTATPDRAGPTTPPAPALATVPPSPGPPGAASASQDSPAVQTTAKPIPNPSRAASKNGNEPATACVNIATDITPPAQSVSLRAPSRSDRTPAGSETARVASPVAPSTMPCWTPVRPNRWA